MFFQVIAVFLLALIPVLGAVPAQAEPLAKELFGAQKSASRQKPAAYGSYAKGCAAGLEQLPETGPTWQAMRLSRNRNWGHPETIDFIRDLSGFAARQKGWSGLYIGDISQPRGGPMLTGHRSHQLGLDIDIWMLQANNLRLSGQHRENISSISLRRAKGAYVNDNWTRQHHAIMREAARDKRVARIFVFPGAKVWMCNNEKGDRSYLRKIRPWWGHHYHFHVRLSCPRGSRGCVDQTPPPQGDGCAEAQEWVNNILNPPPPKPRDPNAPPPKKRREYVLADLPKQCASVLRSQ
ncbi:murein endopeptidase [Ruegeria pomeroyi DSS-3]|uniref:Murein endopeptidase n=1 Tax=Ruegeria pomeroyi (strain ATCC 700808 / DSM 15171 / DSS-3) TaxID=246200 RepID=Q5LWS6_RUEPO|nr:murein endopeptidase [Ruegeria pomeroyi DSS-3]